jgi:ligand-binding sensor domain-containing protein
MLPWIFFLGSIFHFAYGQNGWTIYKDTNSGLPQNTVRCIAVDTITNLKWVGTDYGLASFDGTNWVTYNTGNSAIPDNTIRSLLTDGLGNLWVGTNGSGLAKFDGASWTVYNTSNSGIPDNLVKAMALDTAGDLWVGTPSALGKFDGSTWAIWNSMNSNLTFPHVTRIAVDKNNIKCVGTLNGGLYYFNDTTFTNYSYWLGTLPENTITGVAIDSAGSRWWSMSSAGVIENKINNTWFWSSTSNSNIISDATTYIYIDDAQRKYVTTADRGIMVLSGINNWVNYDSSNSAFPDSWAICCVKDTNGILWIGTFNEGLVRADESVINGIINLSQDSSLISFWPNPCTDELYVQTKEQTQIKIFDLAMRKIQEWNGGKNAIAILNIQNLAPGIYFLKCGDAIAKLIKK